MIEKWQFVQYSIAKFEVITAVLLKGQVFRDGGLIRDTLMKDRSVFETLGTTFIATHRHVPEDLYLQA